MSPAERLEEGTPLLARGILRQRLSRTLHSYGDGARDGGSIHRSFSEGGREKDLPAVSVEGLL